MKDKFKKLALECLAFFVVCAASAMICIFMAVKTTFFTAAIGITGMMLLAPAQQHYVEVFKNLFSKKS